VTPEVLERWKGRLHLSDRSVAKYLVILHGIFKRAMKVWGLPRNPVAEVERPRYRVSDDLDAFSPWRSSGETSTSPARRSVCGGGLCERKASVGEEDIVFPGEFGLFQDATSLRWRYKGALSRAGLRPLRFHDLRHTFGTLAVRRAEVPAVQAGWGTPTSIRPCAMSTTVIAAERRSCWQRPSRSTRWPRWETATKNWDLQEASQSVPKRPLACRNVIHRVAPDVRIARNCGGLRRRRSRDESVPARRAYIVMLSGGRSGTLLVWGLASPEVPPLCAVPTAAPRQRIQGLLPRAQRALSSCSHGCAR
jgi:hypothetical protein